VVKFAYQSDTFKYIPRGTNFIHILRTINYGNFICIFRTRTHPSLERAVRFSHSKKKHFIIRSWLMYVPRRSSENFQQGVQKF
jgi:hypothetical protein